MGNDFERSGGGAEMSKLAGADIGSGCGCGVGINIVSGAWDGCAMAASNVIGERKAKLSRVTPLPMRL